MSAVSSVSGSSSTAIPDGLSTMSGQDFLKVMLTQLQQQDPLNPSNSDQLLSQMSQIRAMEASEQTTTSLQGLTLQQSIGAASNLMGKTVQGIDAGGHQIQGVVTSVQVQNSQVLLGLAGGQTLPMQNVTNISGGPAAAAGAATTPAVTPVTPAAN